jgi:hypothetical protein
MAKYSPGDVIAECLPQSHVLSIKEKGKRCDYCFKEGSSLKKCSKCKSVYYCNPNCQKKDWEAVHKHEECRVYEKYFAIQSGNFLPDLDRLLLKLHLRFKFKKEGCHDKFELFDGRNRGIFDMEDHKEDIEKDSKRMAMFAKVESRLLKSGYSYNKTEFKALYFRIVINSFSVLDDSLNEIGTGLYVAASIFDHSCQPNAAPVFDCTKLEIRALRPIADGETILINYIDLKLPTFERIQRLEHQYYFTCSCARCSNHKNDYKLCVEMKELDQKFDTVVNNCDSWKEAYICGLKSLPLYEQVYGQFHPDLTVQLFRIVKVRLLLESSEIEDGLSFLLTKLLESMKITHGLHHSLYLYTFQEMVNFSQF